MTRAYRPIAKLEENLWTVDGDLPLPGGVFDRKMTLMRLRDGRIVIHSAILLDESDMNEIERWGEPAFCIVPNRRHRMDAPAFRGRYPALCMVCPAGARERIERVTSVDGGYEILPPELQWRTLATKDDEAAFIFRNRDRGTIVFGDVVFNAPHFGGALGWIFKTIGSTGGPRVTPLMKLAAVADRLQLASQLREQAGTEGLVRLVPGHGHNIEDNPGEVLSRVADGI